MMLDDAALGNEVTNIIRTGQWAQGALREVVSSHVTRFELMDDPYLRERAADVKDMGRRILAYLQEVGRQELVFPDNTILVSEELSPVLVVFPERNGNVFNVNVECPSPVSHLAKVSPEVLEVEPCAWGGEHER